MLVAAPTNPTANKPLKPLFPEDGPKVGGARHLFPSIAQLPTHWTPPSRLQDEGGITTNPAKLREGALADRGVGDRVGDPRGRLGRLLHTDHWQSQSGASTYSPGRHDVRTAASLLCHVLYH